MTDKTNDGGAAFPFEGGQNNGYSPEPGMTLRDWFAGQALAGMLANQGRVGDFAKRTRAADEAYYWADAMLTARAK